MTSMVLARGCGKRGFVRGVMLGTTGLVALAAAVPAIADTYTVTDSTSLIAAINAANANPGNDTIVLANDISMSALMPVISDGLTIDGGGFALTNTERLFFIDSATSTVNINNFASLSGNATGGAGGNMAGGGMGAGGAIFVNAGTVNVTNVVFNANTATGGAGGAGSTQLSGGGGGGLGGTGGDAGFNGGAGGGGGFSGGGGGGGGSASSSYVYSSSYYYNSSYTYASSQPAGIGGTGDGGSGGTGGTGVAGAGGFDGGSGGNAGPASTSSNQSYYSPGYSYCYYSWWGGSYCNYYSSYGSYNSTNTDTVAGGGGGGGGLGGGAGGDGLVVTEYYNNGSYYYYSDYGTRVVDTQPGGGGGGGGLGGGGGVGGTGNLAAENGGYGTGGGGSAGVQLSTSPTTFAGGGDGGTFGGGGGGSVYGAAGAGGFGGGGGGGGDQSSGGGGGFGGGSGGSVIASIVVGGFGGGTGDTSGGGGGAGLGGAIFANAGATLNIGGGVSFQGSSATGGASSGTATSGQGLGSDLFLMSGTTTGMILGAGETSVLTGTIADDSANTLVGGTGSGAAIAVSGGGTLDLQGQSTIGGGFTVDGSTLKVGSGGVIDATGNAVTLVGTGTIVDNSGILDGNSGAGVTFNGASGKLINRAGGQIAGGGAAITIGGGDAAIDLEAGSTATGDIVNSSGGIVTTNVDGMLDGQYAGAAGIDRLRIGTGGVVTGAVLLGDGNDWLTLAQGASFASADGGAGEDVLFLEAQDGDPAFDLSMVTGFEGLGKAGSGTLTLNGLPAGFTALYAGNGSHDGGTLALSGAGGSFDIYVNGATLRALNEGALGSGTIHMIDPTISYAASGTYTNDIALEVASPASADPSVLQVDPGVDVTLTGVIATGTTATTDLVQYVTIDGSGSVTLTNAANSWLGTTTINGGATLTGTNQSVSGGAIIDNGVLNYAQATGGIVSQDISGGGIVNVYGLNSGETLTFAGNLTNSRLGIGFGSTVELEGTNSFGGPNGVELSNDGKLIVADGASVSASSYGVLATGANGIIDNQGTINGNYVGVSLFNGSIVNGTATNTDAVIYGFYTGSSSGGGVSLDNYGTVRGTLYNGIDGYAVQINNRAGATIEGLGLGGSYGFGVGALSVSSLSGSNAGAILGRYAGLESRGALDFTNSGLIGSGTVDGSGNFAYSDGQDGVRILGGGTLTNSAGGQVLGSVSGVYINNQLATVINGGTINGGQSGLYSDTGVSLTNQTGAAISGGNMGVFARGANSQVDNAGTISGNGQGVYLYNGGSVTNSGTISGGTGAWYLRGILVQGADGAVTNAAGATISGGRGIDFEGVGGTVDNAGTINGSIDAVQISGTGTVTNRSTGILAGHDFGVRVSGSNSTVTNYGTISANTGSYYYYGVRMDGANATVTNTAGATMSGGGGIYLGGTATVVNSGQVSATSSSGDGIQTSSAISVTNNAGGTISANRIGIASFGPGLTLTNGGAINGNQYGAIYTSGGTSSIVNLAGGTITGAANANALNLRGGISITNGGTISSGPSAAIYLSNGGTVINQASGDIHSDGWALVSGAPLALTNSGLMSGLTYNGAYIGGAGSTVTNNVGGTITGGNAGLYIDGANATITNHGTINVTGGSQNTVISGIFGSASSLAVTNDGTIASTLAGGNGIRLDAGGTVTNLAGGAINGGGGAGSFGITVGGASDIVNAGTIGGGANGAGIQFGAGSGGTLTNQSGGTIGGATAVVLNTTGAVAVNLQAGSTTGKIVSLDSGSRTLTVGGTLTGGYDASAGTGVDDVTLLATGSLAGASLGDGDDGFTTLGGAIGGMVDGGEGNDMLTFNIAGTASYDAALFAGFEARSKTGAGTLTLTGADALTSNFAVNAGVLVASGGAAINDAAAVGVASGATFRLAGNEGIQTLSGSGNVDLQANMLTLLGDANGAFSGVIGGTGSLYKSGLGNFVLSGANSYTGPTLIGAGTLSLGASGVLSDSTIVSLSAAGTFNLAGFNETVGGLSGDGAVTLGAGTLTLNQGANLLYTGAIGGTGGFVKGGSGALYLTGNSGYTGATLVNGGLLSVNGTLASAVTVNSGGRLGGNGTIGGLTVNSGATLAPGNSIGTMHVSGTLTFASGSTYEVEINPTASDLTVATGAVTINGGTVNVLGAAGTYAPLTTYQILQGASVTGTFAGVVDNLAFLDPTLSYTATAVNLTMRRNDIDFAAVADNANQAAVAGAVQSIGVSNLYDAVLVQDAAGARTAFNALTGEIYATTLVVLTEQSDRMRQAMLTAGRGFADGLSAWGDAREARARYDGDSGRGSADARAEKRDLIGGLSYRKAGLTMVAGIGTMGTETDMRDRASRSDSTSWMAGAQAGFEAGTLRVSAGLSKAWHDIDTDRAIVFPGFSDTARSAQKGTSWTLHGEIASRFGKVAGAAIEPYVGLAHQRTRVGAVVEDGGEAALDVGTSRFNSTMAEAGLRLAAPAPAATGFFPAIDLALQQRWGDRTGSVLSAFDLGGDSFRVTGAELDKTSLKIDAGVGYQGGGARIGVSYNGRIGGDSRDQGARVNASIRF